MDQKPLSSEKIVGLVLNVHRDPGLGMPEIVYGHSFACELEEDDLAYQQEAKLPWSSKPKPSKPHYCVDILINGKMAVELKGVGQLRP